MALRSATMSSMPIDCCERTVYDDQFDERQARERQRDYRKHGPNGWTARLVEGLAAGGVDGLTVLDIGAGVGGVHLALLAAGAASAVDVDASGPYLTAAREEADRLALSGRVTYLKGDAVALVPDLQPAELVALDRVVCCYPHMEDLVGVAVEATLRRMGMVLPRDDAWLRAGVGLSNRWSALWHNPFRVYAHRTADVLRIAERGGLAPVESHRGLFWQMLILERAAS